MSGGTRRSLRASIVYSAAGNFFYLGTQLGILSALSRFHGPAAVGVFGLALAITTPLFHLSNMGLRTAQATDLAEDFTFAEYGGARAALTMLAAFLSILAALVLADSRAAFLMVCVIVAAKTFESVSNLAYGAFQQADRLDLVAASLAWRGAVTLVAFVGLLSLGAGSVTAFLAQVAVWGAVAMLLDYPRASRIKTGGLVTPSWIPRRTWRVIWQSAPLAGGTFANALQMSVPRLFVERYLGVDALGLFTAIGYFHQASVTASNAVSHAIVSRFARWAKDGQYRPIYKTILALSAIFATLGGAMYVVLSWYGEPLLTILFGPAFAGANSLLLVVTLAITVRIVAVLPQTLLVAERRLMLYLAFQVTSLALAILVSIFFIERWGLIGAGYVLLFTAAFRLVFMEFLALILRRRRSRRGGSAVAGGERPGSTQAGPGAPGERDGPDG